jgi:hypothetical protein
MAFKMKGSPIKLGKIQGTSGHASALKQVENPLDGYSSEYLASLTPEERRALRKENVGKLRELSNKELNELVDYETETYNLGDTKTYSDPFAKDIFGRPKAQVLKTPRTGIFSNLTKKQRKRKEDYLKTMARKRREDAMHTPAMTHEEMEEFEKAGIDPTTMGNE